MAAETVVRFLIPGINFVGESSSLQILNKYGSSSGYKPNAQGISWGAKIYTDNYGFRTNPAQTNARVDDTALPSIVILGDSVTLGIGVQAKDTFANLISQNIQGYLFYNTSVTGYDLANYKDVIEKFIIPRSRELHIKKVLLFYTLNDISRLDPLEMLNFLGQNQGIEYKGMVTFTNKLREKYDFNRFLIPRSKLYLFLKKCFYDSSKAWFLFDYQEYNNNQSINNLKSTFSDIKIILDKADIELIVFIIPYEFQLRVTDKKYLLPQEIVARELNRINIKNYDLYPAVRKTLNGKNISAKELFLFNDHCHLSVKGHLVVAKEVLKILNMK